MAWADDEIAGPMGFKYAVLFPRARDAMWAYLSATDMKYFLVPENVCSAIASLVQCVKTDQTTGLCEYPVHLYGYRQEARSQIELDPLMTGWGRKPQAPSAIVSFGRKKFISIGHGGAFLTNDQSLAECMEPTGHWPFSDDQEATALLRTSLKFFQRTKLMRFDKIALWDRHLGDMLTRIPAEQVIPWRVMRLTPKRDTIVGALRRAGQDAGTNYPPLAGRNEFGDTVINLPISEDYDEDKIKDACKIIGRNIIHG